MPLFHALFTVMLVATPPSDAATKAGPAPTATVEPKAESSEVLDPIAVIERFQRALFKKAAPSVVMIEAGGGLGSGFFVSKDGLILTNLHVVGDARRIKVTTFDGHRYQARTLERAEGMLDLALLRLVSTKGEPLKLKTTPLVLAPFGKLSPGSWVASIGHGLGGGWTLRADLAFSHLPTLALECSCLVISANMDAPVYVDNTLAGYGPTVVVAVEPGIHHVRSERGKKSITRQIRFPKQQRVSVFLSPTESSDVGKTRNVADGSKLLFELTKPKQMAAALAVVPRWLGLRVEVTTLAGVVQQGILALMRPPTTLVIRMRNGKRLAVEDPSLA